MRSRDVTALMTTRETSCSGLIALALLLTAVNRLSVLAAAENCPPSRRRNGLQQTLSIASLDVRVKGKKENQYCKLGNVVANFRWLQLHTRRILQSRLRMVIVAKGTQLSAAGAGQGGNNAEHKQERRYSPRVGASCSRTAIRYCAGV